MQKIVLFFAFLLLFFSNAAEAQQSSKSKSKDRFREKSDLKYPVRVYAVRDINKSGTEIAPAYYEDGLIIVSGREGKESAPIPGTDDYFNKHYFSPFDPNGDPVKPNLWELDDKKKSPMHEGAICYSRDSKVAYYTRTNNKNGVVKAGRDGVQRLKIYKAVYGKPDWKTTDELHFNNDDYNCKHPSLSADGRRLFFSSDMPGGFGGFDLYVVERTPAGWSKAKNLGPVINSEKDETYPYIALTNTLFFSSNGRENSMGGFDLYYINNPLDSAELVVNFGAPFNSASDDVSLIMDDEGKSGFFASNREGGFGKMDVYRFVAERGLEGLSKPETNPLQITVTDAKTRKPIQGASIRILQTAEDGTLVSGANKDFYSFDLIPVQDKPNMLSFQVTRKDADDLGRPDLFTNAAGQANYELTRYRTYMVLVSFDGFHTGDRFFFIESDKTLNLNFELSEAPFCIRAGGVVLTEVNGTRIPGAKLKFVHTATDKTVTARTNLNGEYDCCLPVDGDWLMQIEREGFKPENLKIKANKSKRPYNEIRLRALTPATSAAVEETLPLANILSKGSVVVMDKVFYDQNKATLNAGAVRQLDFLHEQLMKRYPEMEIDLVVHTDTRGDALENLKLSKERAQNAKDYLEHKGVLNTRVTAIGKGESEPRNRCADGANCSQQEHEQNNRIEIVVRHLGRYVRP
jgi:outer membrane protein OmpA-like peptidoglycan-associated protein